MCILHRLVVAGGRGEGGKPEAALGEPGAGPVHREPHDGQLCVPVYITQGQEKVSPLSHYTHFIHLMFKTTVKYAY